ncbi:FAD-dependent oxidoreductase, partial [Streptomyces carpinensis]
MRTDLAVIGAGPAGLAAALAAAARGLRVTVLDSAPAPGGQFHRQPAPG